MSSNLPIGVFDSGIGGLTVLKELTKLLPNEDFIYVGDTLNLPYGTKDDISLNRIVYNVTNYLVRKPVKAIVIACNTASTKIDYLKSFFNVPIIGVIKPTAEYASKIGTNLLVLGTNVTINSNAYQNELDKIKKGNNYYCKCSPFVDAIENNEINTPYSYKLVNEILHPYLNKNIDTIICGCTHFGLYEKEFKSMFNNVNILECGKPTGLSLTSILKENDLLTDNKSLGKIYIFLTKMEKDFEKKISWFGRNIESIKEIKIN